MDWDETLNEAKANSASPATPGADLAKFSIAELEALMVALETEMSRVRSEIEIKRQRAAAADAFFRS